jgi:hypothetical protein
MKKITAYLLAIGLALTAQAHAKKSLTVDLSKSTVYAFDGGRMVKALVINPGDSDNPTRPGKYKISQKVRSGYRSNLVNTHNRPLKKGELGAPMDYWMRLGGTGMGFHRSSLWRPNGRWGSHGCLRMSRAGARWLFGWAPMGTPVTVLSGGTTLASAVDSKYASTKSHRSKKSLIALRSGSKRSSSSRAKSSRPIIAKAKVKPVAPVAKAPTVKAPVAKAPAETPATPKPAPPASEPSVSTVDTVKPETPQQPNSQ